MGSDWETFTIVSLLNGACNRKRWAVILLLSSCVPHISSHLVFHFTVSEIIVHLFVVIFPNHLRNFKSFWYHLSLMTSYLVTWPTTSRPPFSSQSPKKQRQDKTNRDKKIQWLQSPVLVCGSPFYTIIQTVLQELSLCSPWTPSPAPPDTSMSSTPFTVTWPTGHRLTISSHCKFSFLSTHIIKT